MELLPSTRPSLPETDRTPVLPAWTRQALPSEAMPHPGATLRPANVSSAKTIAPIVVPTVQPDEGDGLGEGLGTGDGGTPEIAAARVAPRARGETGGISATKTEGTTSTPTRSTTIPRARPRRCKPM